MASRDRQKALMATCFYYSVQGQIRHGQLPFSKQLYVKSHYHHGADWIFCHGIEEGLSQMSLSDAEGRFVWNFPLQSSWKSTNPHGWPRLVLSLYGPDAFGNDVVHGYGCVNLPTGPGTWSRTVPIYRPQSATLIQQWTGWLTGRRPELADPSVVARGDGRDVLRTETQGFVTVEFQCTLKDFQSLGYDSHG